MRLVARECGFHGKRVLLPRPRVKKRHAATPAERCQILGYCLPEGLALNQHLHQIATSRGLNAYSGGSRGWSFLGKGFGQQIAATKGEQRRFDADFWKAAKQGNKSFILKSRGSSVVEQPIRNRSCAQRSKTFPNFA